MTEIAGVTVKAGRADMDAIRAALPRFKHIAFVVIIDYPPETSTATGAALVDVEMLQSDPALLRACIEMTRQTCASIPLPDVEPEGRDDN